MGLLVALPQPVNGDVGIDLRGGQAAVAKDFLDCPQVGPAVGIPYVVFAGNVGETASLARVVRTLAD